MLIDKFLDQRSKLTPIWEQIRSKGKRPRIDCLCFLTSFVANKHLTHLKSEVVNEGVDDEIH